MKHKKIAFSLLVILFLSFKFSLFNNFSLNSSNFLFKEYPKSAWEILPIQIDDAATGIGANNWTWASSQFWCSGSGSFIAPYVIQNVTIDGLNTSSCISIVNSDVYFTIENCTLTNSGPSMGPTEAGINLYNVNNSLIYDNNIEYHYHDGIKLENCNNISIEDNEIKDCRIGIYLANLNNDIRDITMKLNVLMNCELHIFGGYTNSMTTVSTYDIDTSNEVDNKPLYFYKDQLNLNSGNFANAGQIILYNCNDSIISSLLNLSGGISLLYCTNTTIEDNNIFDSLGITLIRSNENNILNNNINNNLAWGVSTHFSRFNQIIGNTIQGSLAGVDVEFCENNSITENLLKSNQNGIILRGSQNNTIYQNYLLENLVNAQTLGGDTNFWDYGGLGNYWDDYNGTDINEDNIGDIPYNISIGNQDNFPIFSVIPEINVLNPIINQAFRHIPPEFDVTIEGVFIEDMWYSINGATNKSFTGSNFIISQTLWDSLSDGLILIRIYANNSLGFVGIKEFTILKDTTTSQLPPEILGYDLYLLLGVLGLISAIIIRKHLKS